MTPAIIAANRAGIQFSIHEYHHDPKAASYGEEAAEKLGVQSEIIFKTLVVQADNKSLAVAIVPVLKSLDLKAVASALKHKKLQMADKALVQRVTGYILGGVSPLGQKKALPTVIDISAEEHQHIYVSGGRRGLDIALKPEDLITLCNARVNEIARPPTF